MLAVDGQDGLVCKGACLYNLPAQCLEPMVGGKNRLMYTHGKVRNIEHI